MICLAVDFLLFIMLGVLEAAWIHGLISPINFGKFSAIIMSNSFSLYLSEFSLTCVTPFLVVSRLLVCLFNFLFILFFFSFAFQFGKFYWHIFKRTDFFFGHVQATDESIKSIFHFCIFDFWDFLLLLRVSISLSSLPICSYMLSTLSRRALSILVIVILNSRSDNSKISVISGSVSDVCFVSSDFAFSYLFDIMAYNFLLLSNRYIYLR